MRLRQSQKKMLVSRQPLGISSRLQKGEIELLIGGRVLNKLKSYYVDLQDGYEVGDLYEHKGEMYEVIRIEAFNQLMEVEEIKENSKKD